MLKIIMCVYLFIAVISDLKTMKIKNGLTVFFICVGLLMKAMAGINAYDFLWFCSGFVIVLAVSIFLSMFPFLGAGDLKLFPAIYIYTGLEFTWKCFLFSVVIGGVAAFARMIRNEICKKGTSGKRKKKNDTWEKAEGKASQNKAYKVYKPQEILPKYRHRAIVFATKAASICRKVFINILAMVLLPDNFITLKVKDARKLKDNLKSKGREQVFPFAPAVFLAAIALITSGYIGIVFP